MYVPKQKIRVFSLVSFHPSCLQILIKDEVIHASIADVKWNAPKVIVYITPKRTGNYIYTG